jgi:hypothetical protein
MIKPDPLELPPCGRAQLHGGLAGPSTPSPIRSRRTRSLRALRDYQGPRERTLRLSDVKDMFEQMRDHT